MPWNEPGDDKKRDPWTGKPRSDSPPDLDEALKRFNRKLSDILGTRKGGQSGGDQGGVIGLSMVFIIALLIWALSGIFIVGPAERAVILRFGDYQETVGPGPHWIPRFISTRFNVDIENIWNYQYQELMLTKDENIISVALAVQYRVDKPREYLFNVVNPPGSLEQATASAVRQVVGNTDLDQALTTGREAIRSTVEKQITDILSNYKAGLLVTKVTMQPIKPPEEVTPAYDDAIKAQEDEQRFENLAEAYAKRVVPEAQGKAERMVREAKADAEQLQLRAKAGTAQYLAILPEYRFAPSVTRERMYLETLESILSKSSKILVDEQNGSQNLLYLPLNQLLQQANAEENVTKIPTRADVERVTRHVSTFREPNVLRDNIRSHGNLRDRDSYQGREIS